MSRHRALASEEMAETTDPQAHLSDLDRLASETRDIGQLSEPLADSVLNYTLRRLKPDAKVDSRAVQELEKSLYPDELAQTMDKESDILQMIDRDSNSQRQNLFAPMMRLDGQSYSATADQGNSDISWIPPVSRPWNRMGTAPVPSLHSNSYDWWQLGLDSLQQPILPYDELLSLDFGA